MTSKLLQEPVKSRIQTGPEIIGQQSFFAMSLTLTVLTRSLLAIMQQDKAFENTLAIGKPQKRKSKGNTPASASDSFGANECFNLAKCDPICKKTYPKKLAMTKHSCLSLF